MILKDRFKRELEGFQIYDNYIRNSSIDNSPIEYLIFGLDNHYYVMSYLAVYVLSEIEKPDREAFEIPNTNVILSRNKLVEYLKRLRIRVN